MLLGTQTWYGVEAEGNEPQAGTPSPAPSPALFFPSLPCVKNLTKKFIFFFDSLPFNPFFTNVVYMVI